MKQNEAIMALTKKVLNPNAPSYDVSALSDSINRLFQSSGTEDISSIVEQMVRQQQITIDEGSNILRVAVWSGSENGERLLKSLDNWLREASDSIRVTLAMGQDTYPFHDPKEMQTALAKISKKFPE